MSLLAGESVGKTKRLFVNKHSKVDPSTARWINGLACQSASGPLADSHAAAHPGGSTGFTGDRSTARWFRRGQHGPVGPDHNPERMHQPAIANTASDIAN